MTQPIPFGKYYLLERINVGGMAEVFKAKAFGVEGFERLVAVKRILPNIAEDEEFITMFIDEAKIAVQLQHANIAQIFDLGKVDDSYFIALEYVHGKDLRAIFDHLRKVGERDADRRRPASSMMQVCEGLDYAHNKRDAQGRELNLVHRDVSPQNILVGYEGEVKLIDFGIAKAAGKASQDPGRHPQGQVRVHVARAGARAAGRPAQRHLRASASCLYELLTGERLFVGESDFSTLEKVRNVEILPPSSFNQRIPAELERIVLKALAKDVEDRYQNAIDLHDDLQAFLYSIGRVLLAQGSGRLDEEDLRRRARGGERQATPSGSSSSSRRPAAASRRVAAQRARPRGGRGHGRASTGTTRSWRPRSSTARRASRRARRARTRELSSADILLQDDGSRVRATPSTTRPPSRRRPTRPQLALDDGLAHAAGAGRRRTAPARQRLPPPGLSAYRRRRRRRPGSTDPLAATAAAGAAPARRQRRARRRPGSPFRQTIMGLPQRRPPQYQAPPAPLPPPSYGRRRRAAAAGDRRSAAAPARGAPVATIAGRCWRCWWRRVRPLQLLQPAGQAGHRRSSPPTPWSQLDGVVLEGRRPISSRSRPGPTTSPSRKEGYSQARADGASSRPGELERVAVQLEASPDTGFELTSDPPGQLVWLDGAALHRQRSSRAAGAHRLQGLRACRPAATCWRSRATRASSPGSTSSTRSRARSCKIRATLEPASAAGGAPAQPRAGRRRRAGAAAAPPVPAPPPPPAPPRRARRRATRQRRRRHRRAAGARPPPQPPRHAGADARGAAPPPAPAPAPAGAAAAQAAPRAAARADRRRPRAGAEAAGARRRPRRAAGGRPDCSVTIGSQALGRGLDRRHATPAS